MWEDPSKGSGGSSALGVHSDKMDQDEVVRLVSLYDLERYLFQVVFQHFASRGTLSAYDFFAIVSWKSNRAKTKIKKGLAAAGRLPSELMREVAEAERTAERVRLLTQIHGIGLPIASAILSVCYPDTFTVLDYRAWETLCELGLEELPRSYPRGEAAYLQYCRACQTLAHQLGLSLRDLDRALWAKSWEDGLLGLLKD